MTERPAKLEWEHCPCGSSTCHRQHPTNLGVFYEGSGFEPHEVEWLNRAWTAVAALEDIAASAGPLGEWGTTGSGHADAIQTAKAALREVAK
jgi:hypothetical protein